MSAVIGCGIAAAVFAFVWDRMVGGLFTALVGGAALGFAIAAAVMGILA